MVVQASPSLPALEEIYKAPVLRGFLIFLVPLTLYLGLRDLAYNSPGALFFFIFQSFVVGAAWFLHLRKNYTGASHITVFGVALAQILDLSLLGYQGRHSFYMVSLVNSLLLLGGGFLLTGMKPLAILSGSLWTFYLYFILSNSSTAAALEPNLPWDIQLSVPTIGLLVFTSLALGSRKIFEGIIQNQQSLVRESEEAQQGLGHLIRGIAHRLNTPLGNARMILSSDSLDSEEHRALLSESVNVSLELINRLRAFLACTEIKKGSKGSFSDQFDLLVGEVSEARADLGNLRDSKGFQAIRVHHWEAIHLILKEIWNNASVHSPPDKPWKIAFTSEADSSITFTFSNRAPGIKTEDLTRFLRPFFSTLNQSDHPGLGLYFTGFLVQKTLKGRIILDIPEKDVFQITVSLPGSWQPGPFI